MSEILGYMGLALLLTGMPVPLIQHFGATRLALLGYLFVALAVLLVPWNGHSVVFYLRGVVGDLSIASLVLLCLIYARAFLKPYRAHQPIRGQVGWMLMAILLPLYASTMGYFSIDLYGWGYEPQWFLVLVGLLMFWAWRIQPALAFAWLIGVVSFASGMTGSRNIWDALFDPFMAFAAIGIATSSVMRAVFSKKSTPQATEEPGLRNAA